MRQRARCNDGDRTKLDKKNPRGILRHAPEIIKYKDTTFTQLMGEVLFREYELTELDAIREGEV